MANVNLGMIYNAINDVEGKQDAAKAVLDLISNNLAKTMPVDGQNLIAAIAAQTLLKALRNGDLTKEELLEALNGALFVNPRTSGGAELFTLTNAGVVSLKNTLPLVTTHQNAATANGNGMAADVDGYGSAMFQVIGTFNAKVNFEGSVDGVNYVPIFVLDSSGNRVTSATTPGIFRADIAGLKSIRAPISNYVSGAVTVTSRALPIARAVEQSVLLNGRNVTNTADLQATFEDDGTGKGLLRVFLASVLDAAQDSVAIAGARADSLYRRREDTIEKTGRLTLSAAGQSGDYVEIVNTTSAIVVDLLDVALASDSELDLRIEIYTKQPDNTESVYEIVRWSGTKPVVGVPLLGYIALGDTTYSNSFGQDPYFVRSIKTDTVPKYHKIMLRENRRLEMPRGGRIRFSNISTSPKDIAYHIRYGVYAV